MENKKVVNKTTKKTTSKKPQVKKTQAKKTVNKKVSATVSISKKPQEVKTVHKTKSVKSNIEAIEAIEPIITPVKNKPIITDTTEVKKEVVVKKQPKRKRKRAFTLIELLAVIIILGILMIIAIPSVTKYISDSRKSAYVDTAKEIVSGTRNVVNEGRLGMYDTDATYYIPAKYINTENASKSPYGEFTEAYVGVIYDGKGYKYYWISVDETGQGFKYITFVDELDIDDIVSDLNSNDIKNTVETTGIGNRSKIMILNPDSETWNETVAGAIETVTEDGAIIVCKKATSLHSTTCKRTDSYSCGMDVGNGNTITYGTIPEGSPKAGDAYDCKVSKNDGYTERFYYLESEGDNSLLIYYKDMYIDSSYAYDAYYMYDTSGENWHGPTEAAKYLPSTTEWDSPYLIAPGTREIKSDKGDTTTGGTIDDFEYKNKAARIMSLQDVKKACGNSYTDFGYLNNCKYLLENIGYYEGYDRLLGYWLENPSSTTNDYAWAVFSNSNALGTNSVKAKWNGVRPVITIKTDYIEK